MNYEIAGYTEKVKSIEEEKKKTLLEIQDLKTQMVKLEETVQKDEEKKKVVQGTFKDFLIFFKFFCEVLQFLHF